MKKSALVAGLEAAAGRPGTTATATLEAPGQGREVSRLTPDTVLIGAHYSPQVRKVLKLVEAESGKRLKPLLGEAINDLCAKYGKPQPYSGEE